MFLRSEISALLAPSIGHDKARIAVDQTAAHLGFTDNRLSLSESHTLLKHLASQPGLTSVGAKLAIRKLRANEVPSSVPAPLDVRLTMTELAQYLSHVVGVEQAEKLLREVARKLHLSENSLNRREALEVFEHLASQPGVIGVAARFAKTRLHLNG